MKQPRESSTSTDAMRFASPSVAWWIATASVAAYSLWLRTPLMGDSFWLDELHTTWVIGGDWSDLAPRCRIGNQALLYFFALKAWSIFGSSEVWLRLPSLLAGAGLIVFMMWQIQRDTGSLVSASVVGLFAAADRRFIFYATELRPYAFVQLLAAVHATLTLQLATTSSKSVRISWIVCATALFHLHYTAALFLAAEVCWIALILVWRRSSKRCVADRLIDLGALVVLALPSLWHLGEIADRRHLWELIASAGNPLYILTMIDGHVYVGGPLFFAIAAVTMSFCWRRFAGNQPKTTTSPGNDVERALSRSDEATPALLWLLIALLPAAAAWFASAIELAPLFMSRYVIAAAVGPMMLAGHIISATRGWWRVIVAAGALAIVVMTSQTQERFYVWGEAIHDRREDWRGAIDWASEQAAAGESIMLVRSALLESASLEDSSDPLSQDYLLFPVLGTYRVKGLDRTRCYSLSTSPPEAIGTEAINEMKERQLCILVIRGRARDADAIAANLTRQLSRHGIAAKTRSSAGFGLVHARSLELAH